MRTESIASILFAKEKLCSKEEEYKMKKREMRRVLPHIATR